MIIPLPLPPSESTAGYVLPIMGFLLFFAFAMLSAYRMKQLERELRTWRADFSKILSDRKTMAKQKDAHISSLMATVYAKEREIHTEIWKRRTLVSEKEALEKEEKLLVKEKNALTASNERLTGDIEALLKQKKNMARERREERASLEAKIERLCKRIVAVRKEKTELESRMRGREAAWAEERAYLLRTNSATNACDHNTGNTNPDAVELRKLWDECASKDRQIHQLTKAKEGLELAKEEYEDKVLELTDKLSEYHRRLADGAGRDGPSDTSFFFNLATADPTPSLYCPSCCGPLRNPKAETNSGPWCQ